MSKPAAGIATFAVSALLHELLFSLSFKVYKPVFAIGMLSQIPLILVSKRYKGKKRGNLLVWLACFLSFPIVEISYMKSYYEDILEVEGIAQVDLYGRLFCLGE